MSTIVASACSLLYSGSDLRGTGGNADLGVDLATNGFDLSSGDLASQMADLATVLTPATLVVNTNTIAMVAAELNGTEPPELVVLTDDDTLHLFFYEPGVGFPSKAQQNIATCTEATTLVAGHTLGSNRMITIGCADRIRSYPIIDGAPTAITTGSATDVEPVRGVVHMTTGDLNGDGQADIVFAEKSEDPVTLDYDIGILASGPTSYTLSRQSIAKSAAAEEVHIGVAAGATSIYFLRDSVLGLLPGPGLSYNATKDITMQYTTATMAVHRNGSLDELLVGWSDDPTSSLGFIDLSSFGLITAVPASPFPIAIAPKGDLDGDGANEIIVGTYDYRPTEVVAALDVFSFVADIITKTSIPLERVPNYLATADWNADGKDDIAVTSASFSTTVTVLLSSAAK